MATVTSAPTSDLRAVARGGVLNLLGAGYAALVGFGTATLVARGLTHAQAGVFFAATGLFVVVSVVAKLGTPTGLVYWIARLRALDRPDLVRACLAVALRPVVWASVALGVVGWVAAPWITAVAGDAGFATQLRILAVLLPVAALSDTLLAATRGHRTMRPTVLVDRFGRSSLQLAGLVVVFSFAAPTSWYTLAWAAPWLVSAAVARRYLTRLLPAPALGALDGNPEPGHRSLRVRVQRPESVPVGRESRHQGSLLRREFWAFTWPRGVANVLQLLLQRLDVLLVAGLLGFAPAAGYAVATRFTVVGQLGNAAIGTAVEPRLAEALAHDDRATAQRLYQTATGWLVLTAWPIYLLTAIFAPLYLGLFGPSYASRPAVAVVLLLCGAMLVASGCGMVDVVLAMTGRTTWNLGNVSAALVTAVGLNLLLLPRLGIVGGGIAWAAAALVKNLLPLAQLSSGRGLHPFGRGTLTAAALAVGCFGVLPMVARMVAGPGPPALLAGAGAGAVCYLAGLWWLREPLRLSAIRRPQEVT
jgi:O-antigen/teichoic acid export membrane protein